MNLDLEVHCDGKRIKRIALSPGEHGIGSKDSAILLAYPTVSRHHGCLTVSTTGLQYTDLGSRNGSHLIDEHGATQKLEPGKPTHWGKKQALRIGPFMLTLTKAGDGHERASSPNEACRLANYYARLLAESPESARDRLCDELEGHPQREALLERIHHEFHGNGPLHRWLSDPACREILANAHDEIYVDIGRGLRRLDEPAFLSRETFEAWVQRTVNGAGRRLDLQHPICEATLENGARFHAVVPPISARGISIAIRRFGSAPINETEALESGWLEPRALELLKQAVHSKKNIVISGGTSTGKTSLLNFLCRYLPHWERIVTVEDTVELAPPVENLVQLQARTSNADGVGQVTLRQLVQCALRMRPDRIIVGECRGAEVLEMLQALNTGHPGSLTTLHANSTEEALRRLELLALLGASNLSIDCLRAWIRSSVELIIQLNRSGDGRRYVAEIATQTRDGLLNRIYERTDHREVEAG